MEVYDLSPDTNSILGNISTRSFVQTGDDVMIGGFIVAGTEPKRVIVRAIGPELTQYGVPNVHWLIRHWNCTTRTGALIASNDNWLTHDNRRDYHQRSKCAISGTAATLRGPKGVGNHCNAASR